MAIYSPWQLLKGSGLHLMGGQATVLLNHFEGADGATADFIDATGISWTVTNAGASLEADAVKFGTTGVIYPASSDAWATGASNTQQELFSLPTTRFTIEGWWNPVGAGAVLAIAGFLVSDATERITIILTQGATIVGTYDGQGGGQTITASADISAASTGTYYHWAFTVDGDDGAIYFDGNLGQAVSSASPMPTDQVLAAVRCRSQNAADSYFDEFRISSSVRYTGSTYTVPSAAFTLD